MTDIPLTLRLVKGSKLTLQEADNNFTSLRDGIYGITGIAGFTGGTGITGMTGHR